MAHEDKLHVVRAGSESSETAQSAGATRIGGVSPQTAPSERIWLGKVSNKPGYCSVPHHHGEAETAGYVFQGRARIFFGEGFREYLDMEEGDFVFVPPYMPHIEANLSDDAELVWMTARTPDNIVVNLEE